MRKELFSILFVLAFSHMLSAQIILISEPNDIYNLGDAISIPITIKATHDVSGSFEMNLLCQGLEQNFYRNGISLAYGEEITLSPPPSLVLDKSIIGELKGFCKITTGLSEETPVITKEFKISTLINLETTIEKTYYNPGEILIIEGTATKESGSPVNGFAELILMDENSNEIESQLFTSNNGYFKINKTLKENLKAGKYLSKIRAYEKDKDLISNDGFTVIEIFVNQIPKNLEISFEEKEINPRETLRVKAILHDQTGANIQTNVTITIKDSKGSLLEQKIISTDEFLEYPIKYNHQAEELKITAEANLLREEDIAKILEKAEIKMDLINDSIFITNIGNIKYCNKSVLVKIGDESLNLDICLDIDSNKQFKLTAPEGTYQIEVINDGEKKISKNAFLTGNTINIKEAGKNTASLMKYPIVWLFIIAILGFIAFTIFKKGYKKSFFGYIKSKSKIKTPIKKIAKIERGIMNLTGKRAEISLSIKGQKQKSTIIGLRIKNLKELEQNKGSVKDTFNKISKLATEYKTAIYENQDNFFFILSPVKTRTFKNEKPGLMLAQKIKEIIEGHNKLFKQKIDFGISMNNGELIAKNEAGILKFMSIKDAITGTKRIFAYSKNKIVLTEKISKELSAEIKTAKHIDNGIAFFTITQYKNIEEHQKFIKNFIAGLEKEKKKK
jgi:hypothetical protein